jgi:hypothetical protein
MTMTTKAIPLLLAYGLCFASCSHKITPAGHYQSTPVVADGIPNDWTLPLRFADAGYTLQYNVTNDKKNIYVCVLSHDEQTIIRMLRAGITVYFDPKGQTGRDISLHYPLRKQPDPNLRNRNGEPLTNQTDSGWKNELLQQSDSYGTTGFTGIENGQFGVSDTKSPIRVAMQLNNHDSLLVYEAIIPINNILGSDLSSRSPKKTFSVGIVLNTPSGQNAATPSHRNGGGSRGLGLGMNGMHMGGRSRNYNSNNDAPPLREDANWYAFRLVSQ